MNIGLLVFGFVLAGIVDGDSLTVFPPTLEVQTGEGMVLQVLPPLDPLVSCSVRVGGSTVTLEPGKDNANADISYFGRGYEQGDCGAQVNHFNATVHAGTWLFKTVYKDESTSSIAASVKAARDPIWNVTQIIDTALGDPLLIQCEADGSFYCRLVNPDNETVSTGSNCSQIVSSVKMADVGVWRCGRGVTWAAREVITAINVTVHTVHTLEIGQKDEDDRIDLYCNHPGRITFCRWEREDKLTLTMAEGRKVDRYSYYGRGISYSECGLSIQKPLTNDDLKTWKCTLGLPEDRRSGGFITIRNKGEVSKTALEMKQPTGIFALSGGALTLDCSVDIALSYCWFKHPNGTRYYPASDEQSTSWSYHGEGIELGECGITIHSARVEDSGQWSCGMGVQAVQQAPQDLQQKITVRVSDIPFIDNTTSVTASLGDWAILACHSLEGEAIQYCSFIAPNDTSYNFIPDKQTSQQRYQYKGAGLEYGECAILINPVVNDDYGAWQCVTRLAAPKYGQSLVRRITLNPPGLLSSMSLGIPMGIAVAVFLSFGIICYRQRRRPLPNQDQHVGRPVALSTLSDTSDDVVLEFPSHS